MLSVGDADAVDRRALRRQAVGVRVDRVHHDGRAARIASTPVSGIAACAERPRDRDGQLQAAVVRGDDGVREARAEREVGLRDAFGEKPGRAERAAELLVVRQVQFDRAVEREAGVSISARSANA